MSKKRGTPQVVYYDPSQPSIYLHRNPNQGMLLACSHPDCDHATISTWDAEQHDRTCQILHAGHLAVTTTIAAFTSRSSPEDLYLDFDSGDPSTGPTLIFTTMVDIKTNTAATAAASAPPSTKLNEVLEAMSQLTDTVTEFSKHLDTQLERMDEVGERMDWFVAQSTRSAVRMQPWRQMSSQCEPN
ncbi:hypothetical protein BKA57DRAFT_541200 [Linnemannia elongata]|nr:hypothetical protein BKA57DRAFT_541200 [Linnemannia elongata]